MISVYKNSGSKVILLILFLLLSFSPKTLRSETGAKIAETPAELTAVHSGHVEAIHFPDEGVSSGGSQETTRPSSPRFGIKTNLLYLATTTLNLGFEFRLSQQWTLELPISWNPWLFANNKQVRHLLVQPEVRYWTRKPFQRHFLGIHAHYAHFNTGNIRAPFGLFSQWKSSRYQGDLYGAGFSYGYQWKLARHLNLEASLGVGYFRAHYDQFGCESCSDLIGRATKNYFGPTKAAISLIYTIQ